ncbi:DUF3857 domain-containing protein [Dyadobacter diqingensis]|uniref:DUF3857 domain-containing protein n=1 Tax=Dyadobacter diqingensis TaxID=2938121 RepID=UPI0020C41739|nr:DUF3857 domain-containing protein [Dyadobacter diqingensis]
MNLIFCFVKKFGQQFFLIILFSGRLLAGASVGVMPVPSWIIPVVPGGKAASARDFADGYYVTFSDLQVNLEKKTSYYKVIKQIVSESGIQNGSEISVLFDPSYEQVNFHNIIIWRGGKAFSQMKISDFKVMPQETDRQRFIYNGNYSASLILKDIRKGDRIEYAYSITGWNSVFDNKYSNIFGFGAYDFVSHMHYAIIANTNRTLYFKDFNKPPVKTIKKIGGENVYEWDLKNIKSIPSEEYKPSWFYNYPFVQITEFKNWQDVVNWGLKLYQVPDISGQLKSKVEDWKKIAKQSDYEYIEQAIRFVQDEIRYLGIETGENSHRPHSPEEVFRQRYGDCKDKAFLLCALLKANNIECDPVLVNTYNRSHVTEYLPTPADFNHVVVRFAVGDKKKDFHLVDATISMQGGTASQVSFPDYGMGLPLKKGQKDIITISDQDAGSISITEEIVTPHRTDTSGKGTLVAKTIYFGGEANDIRDVFQRSSFSETEKNYLNYYRDTYKHAEFEILDSLEFYDQRNANNVSLIERYSMKNGWQYDSTRRKYYFRITGKMLYDQLIQLPNRPRKNPVSLRYPYNMDYTVKVSLLGGQNISEDHWEIKREAYEASFSSKKVAGENVWELHYTYKTLKDHIATDQIAQFRKDIDKISDHLEYELNETDPSVEDVNNLNIGMILISFLVLAGSIWFCLKIYKYSPISEYKGFPGIDIGGWLILLAIGLVSRPVLIVFYLMAGTADVYFTNSGWNALQGQSASKIFAFHTIFTFELAAIIFGACFSILLIALFFKKRDSFPLLYSIFMGATLAYHIADATISNLFFQLSVSEATLSEITRQIIAVAIWVPYLNKSARVQKTFVGKYDQELATYPNEN